MTLKSNADPKYKETKHLDGSHSYMNNHIYPLFHPLSTFYDSIKNNQNHHFIILSSRFLTVPSTGFSIILYPFYKQSIDTKKEEQNQTKDLTNLPYQTYALFPEDTSPCS